VDDCYLISVASGMTVPLPLLYIITLVYNSIQNDQLAVKIGGEANPIIPLHGLFMNYKFVR
jgi:hypothetical protein